MRKAKKAVWRGWAIVRNGKFDMDHDLEPVCKAIPTIAGRQKELFLTKPGERFVRIRIEEE